VMAANAEPVWFSAAFTDSELRNASYTRLVE
jgi:hypothetical protein